MEQIVRRIPLAKISTIVNTQITANKHIFRIGGDVYLDIHSYALICIAKRSFAARKYVNNALLHRYLKFNQSSEERAAAYLTHNLADVLSSRLLEIYQSVVWRSERVH